MTTLKERSPHRSCQPKDYFSSWSLLVGFSVRQLRGTKEERAVRLDGSELIPDGSFEVTIIIWRDFEDFPQSCVRISQDIVRRRLILPQFEVGYRPIVMISNTIIDCCQRKRDRNTNLKVQIPPRHESTIQDHIPFLRLLQASCKARWYRRNVHTRSVITPLRWGLARGCRKRRCHRK